MRKIKGIVIHHSSTDEGNAKSFKHHHIVTLGWKTIGYNYVIPTSGIKEVGRSENLIPAHCRGNNRNTLGICVVGKLMYKAPLPEQYIALIDLLAKRCFAYNLDPEGTYMWKGKIVYVIDGHKKFCNTDCPGDKFYEMLPQIRIDVKRKLKEQLKVPKLSL